MLSATQSALAAGAAVAAVAGAVWLKPKPRLGRRLPGPPGRFVVGNLADLPQPGEREWVVYGALCDKYGPIIRLDVLGQTIIILDNAEDVKQLFWTRNNNYSNRTSMPMVELIGWGNASGVQQPGDGFRARRRLMNKMLGSGPGGARSVIDVQERAVRHLVHRVASGEVGLTEGIKYMSGYIIVQTAYGYTPREKNDYFVETSEKGLDMALKAHDPGWLVNMLPLARYIPAWLPGGGWKYTVREWRKTVEAADYMPFAWARQQIDAGTAAPSFTRKFLADPEVTVDPELLRQTLSSIYSGGADTTTAVSHYIFLSLALHPDVQTRAQVEIDGITQGDRLPVIGDRNNLPYVEAVLKEIFRWQSIANLALPHVALNDDEYKGYHIPSGAIFIANVWRMLHNPQKYPDPNKFNPDRFLQRDGGAGASDSRAMNPEMINEDPWQYIFGFGSRQCPGRHMADATIWLLLAHILATVNVRDPVRGDGSRITLENLQGPSPGFVGRTDMTSCVVEFRSVKADALFAAEEAASS